MNEWAEILGGLTGEQIKHGLGVWRQDWPPSADEFKSACIGKVKNGWGLDYIPECYRDEPVVDKSRLLSSDQREASIEAAKAELQRMRDILKGKR